MRRLTILFLSLILLSSLRSECATIRKITLNETRDSVKMVIETDAPAKHSILRGNSYMVVILPNISLKPAAPRILQSNVLENIVIEQQNNDCKISANYKYLTTGTVTDLKKPYRTVLEFRRISKMVLPKITVPEIEKVSTKSYPDKFRIAIYLTSFVPFKVYTTEAGLILELPEANSVIKSRTILTKDKLIPKVSIDQIGKSVLIGIAQNYPSFYQIYKQDSPPSLVVEFDKTSKSTVATKDVSRALRYYKFIKGTEEGPSTVNVIIADQRTMEVFPYVARDGVAPPTLFDVIGGIFTFWAPREEGKFKRDKVSNMVKDSGSLAGVNGTFFGKYGEPLGVLMMNGELISYSINDRTALIIDKDNHCFIDNVSLSGDVSLEGYMIPINNINVKRMSGEAVIYTSRFGSETSEDSPGIILSVVGNEVKAINRARGWIPKDGYTLSLDPSYYDTLGDRIRVGSRINLTLKLITFSNPGNIMLKHVIGGGPRLLRSEQIYVTKNSEKFQSDIAKSRAARTAVGITKDGTLAFVTVDKCKQSERNSKSVGVTLEELAQIMKEIDCVDAMNLDGGGSSTMVVSGEVVNCPSNGQEINVSNGVLIR